VDRLHPPLLDGTNAMPIHLSEIMKTKPSLKVGPNLGRKATVEEKVGSRLTLLIIKLAKATIFASSSTKTTNRPHLVLEDQASKEILRDPKVIF
jgi:hypothetical protein